MDSSGTHYPPDGGSLYFRGGWYTEEAIESIIKSEVEKRVRELEQQNAALKAEIQLITAPKEAGGGYEASLRAKLERAEKALKEIHYKSGDDAKTLLIDAICEARRYFEERDKETI